MPLEEYTGLIGKIAWEFKSKWSNISYEYMDLYNEGILVFIECQKSYNPDRGKFSTFLWKCINQHYVDLIRKEQFVDFPGDEYTFPEVEYKPIMSNISFLRLSEDTKLFINIALNTPVELVNKLGRRHSKVINHYIREIKEQLITY
jgi:DNA-directed RNA polymerase specialized sigma24 family protein